MKKLMYFVSFAVMTMLSVSCSNDELDNVTPPTNERVARTATLVFDGNKPSFDDAGTTRAVTDSWVDGSKVYLQFTVGKGRVDGVATYSASTQEWTIEYYGALQATNDGKCEAYYFENAGSADYQSVKLNYETAIYADKSATYSFEGNSVKVTANLKPMTGRIRLKGEPGQTCYVGGISYYNNYSLTNNSFTTNYYTQTRTTAKDGYSDYIYGFFADEDNKEIFFDDRDNNLSYTKVLGSNALSVGKSGYLNIPTMTNRSGWTVLAHKDFEVAGVSFRMIRVISDPLYSKQSYFIGETEVTQALWNAVMNNNPSSPKGDDLPVNKVSWNNCEEFLGKLNTKTNGEFGLPTQAQWQWAAKGGYLSKGYKYSGSNSAGEVAWYSGNSNSTIHPVKTKLPNEIGLYDMSGNVMEWTDKISTSSAYCCGGGFSQAVSNVQWNYYYSYNLTTSGNDIGLRLFMY